MNNIGSLSILTPCYNSGKYLDQAYKSLLNQKDCIIEWHLIDDASSDDTPQIIRSLAETSNSRLHVHASFLKNNIGPAGAINAALEGLSTQYFAFLDSDDWFMENSLFDFLTYLDTNHQCSVVYGQKCIYNEKSELKNNFFFPDKGSKLNIEAQLVRGQFLSSGQYIVRTSAAKTALGGNFKLNTFLHGQNLQLLLPLSFENKFCFLCKPLLTIRLRNDSLSRAVLQNKEKIVERQNQRLKTVMYCLGYYKGSKYRYKEYFYTSISLIRSYKIYFKFAKLYFIRTILHDLSIRPMFVFKALYFYYKK